MKIICSRTQPKTFLSLQVFQQTNFCVVSERIFALHHFLTAKNCILETLWKQISIYHLEKNLFPRRRNVSSGEGWDRERLNKFLGQLTVWALQNVLQFFILIEIFENWTIFIISILPFMILKHWNFPDNLDFKGKIGATFLVRCQKK